MAKKNMTIEEVKKAKIKLESDILDMVKKFENETGVYATYINFQRERDDEDMPEVTMKAERGPLKNVEVNMELDLIY